MNGIQEVKGSIPSVSIRKPQVAYTCGFFVSYRSLVSASVPPSTNRMTPLMPEARGETRNRTTFAISSGSMSLSVPYFVGIGSALRAVCVLKERVAVPSNVAYSAAKGGVVNLTKAAGTAYADRGIRVNCVCPGVINTPLVPEDQKEAYRALHPMHRIGEAFEVAAIITFLVSDDARFITGAAIPVDGGYTSV